MTVTLYLDVYLAVNLLANLVVLALLNLFLKLHGKKSRMLAAAFFGAAAACGMLVVQVLAGEVPVIVRLIFLAGVCAVMLHIAFGVFQPGTFGRTFVGFWLVTAAVAGFFEAVSFQEERKFFTFLCGTAGVYCGGKAGIQLLQRRQSLQKNLYEVTLYYRGKSTKVTALLDSGNRLYEPYGHQPVHVINEECIRKLCHTCNHMILIPFTSVGTERGMLTGMRIDEMEVRKDGHLVRHLKRPWVAISRQPLSTGHQYEMLLHGEEE